ncbi:MAG TPA: hypothetical protein VEZ12_17045, partial [Herpetosiphonaceae bacterium]|nr:hypothetical protein [Herpetosiphonaceae bacterium]
EPWNLANAFGLPFPWYAAHFVWFIVGAVAQFRRYNRESDPVLQQQTKWLVYCLIIVVVVHAFIVVSHVTQFALI